MTFQVRDREGKLLSETDHKELALERLLKLPNADVVFETYCVTRLIKVKEDQHEEVQQSAASAPY